MGLSENAGTAPNTLQHCRNPKVGRASAPAVVHEDKRPAFGLLARLSDREHEQGIPGVWTITESSRGNGLTKEADRRKQALLCGRLRRQPRSSLSVRVKKPHVTQALYDIV